MKNNLQNEWLYVILYLPGFTVVFRWPNELIEHGLGRKCLVD